MYLDFHFLPLGDTFLFPTNDACVFVALLNSGMFPASEEQLTKSGLDLATSRPCGSFHSIAADLVFMFSSYAPSLFFPIQWTLLPPAHGVFVQYRTEPIRPRVDSISVWLRAWTDLPDSYPFRADFDDFALHQVDASIPSAPKR